MKGIGWKLVAIASGLVASQVAKAATKGGWKAVTGHTTPAGAKDPQSPVAEAMVFAAVSAAVVGLTKTFVNRKTAGIYEKSTGKPAPPVAKLRKKTAA